MTKLNNKGMTLMELLVSVLLISVIMIFMYKLISDVRSSKRENDKIMDNIIKISEIEVDSVNEFTSELSYDKNEINIIRIWNDIWYIDSKKINAHYIRFDLIKNAGTSREYAIGIGKNDQKQFEIHIRNKNTGTWKTIKKWTLSKEVKDIEVKEKCNYKSKQLVCEVDLNLLSDNNKIIYTISYPLYFYTNSFSSGLDKSRNCIVAAGNNCFNCPGWTDDVVEGTYSFSRKFSSLIDTSSKPNMCRR